MSECKGIDECVKELNGLYDKLYKRYCGVRACNECILAEGDDECVLNILQDLINKLEEKQL